MKYGTIAVVAATLFMITGVSAQQDVNLSEKELDQAQKFFNEYNERLPGFLQNVLGDQRVNANIETDNNTVTYSAITEGITVTNLTRERLDNPTLVVNTSEETIEDIYEANNSAKMTQQKISNGEITYQSYGMFNRLKTFIFNLFVG